MKENDMMENYKNKLEEADDFFAGGEFDKAIESAREYLKNDPDNLDALIIIALSYYLQDKTEEMIEALSIAHNKQPTSAIVSFMEAYDGTEIVDNYVKMVSLLIIFDKIEEAYFCCMWGLWYYPKSSELMILLKKILTITE